MPSYKMLNLKPYIDQIQQEKDCMVTVASHLFYRILSPICERLKGTGLCMMKYNVVRDAYFNEVDVQIDRIGGIVLVQGYYYRMLELMVDQWNGMRNSAKSKELLSVEDYNSLCGLIGEIEERLEEGPAYE